MKTDATHSSFSGGETSSVATDERDYTLNANEHTKMTATRTSSAGIAQKSQRLVEWNTDILLRSLHSIVVQRQLRGAIPDAPSKMASAEKNIQKPGSMVFDEIADIISIPEYDSMDVMMQEQKPVEVDKVVIDQLREYVSCIAGLYRDNKFHNFEHASHVRRKKTVSHLLYNQTSQKSHPSLLSLLCNHMTTLAGVNECFQIAETNCCP